MIKGQTPDMSKVIARRRTPKNWVQPQTLCNPQLTNHDRMVIRASRRSK